MAHSLADGWIIDGLTEQFGVRKANQASDKRIAESIRASLFPKQKQVLDDVARFKAAICPRRAGKSWTAMSYVFDTCLRKPLAKCVIVTLTLKSAKNIYWQEIQRFAQQFGIACQYNHTELRVTLPNGASFFLIGAESKAEIEKLRGGKYHLVIIDECKSYPPSVFEELVTDVIKPALMDYKGTLLMIGTPGNVLEGLFYQATYPGLTDDDGRPYSKTFDAPEQYWVEHPNDRGGGFTGRVRWSRHAWTLKDNDRTEADMWELALEEKADNKWADDHPSWQREYLGQWVPAHDVYVYAYATLHRSDPDRVHWHPRRTRENPAGLPDPDDDWRFVLGADLGYEDDFAIVVSAYSPHRGELYHVWDYKDNHQNFYDVVEKLQAAWDKFGGFDAMVGDAAGLGKMVVETILQRHGLPLQPAEKTEKFDHIEILNGDFHSGRIKIIPGSDLALELSALQFDLSKHSKKELVRTGKLRENPQLPNHLCDAFLYSWRFAHHYWAAPKKQQYAYRSSEWEEQQEEAWIQRMVAGRNQETSPWEQLRSRSYDPLTPFYRRNGR